MFVRKLKFGSKETEIVSITHRDRITSAYRYLPETSVDRQILSDAHTEYTRAKVAFSVVDNDDTMINLIGSWSRINRIMWQMEDKYGVGK